MKITISQHLDITEVPEPLLRKIRDTFTIENPKWLENHKMRRWQGRMEHWLMFYENHPGGLMVPRGAVRLILSFCKELNIRPEIIDQRRTLPKVNFTFLGTLRDFQKKAVIALIKKYFGTLSAPTASGKTVMAFYLIAERGQPTLIVVHTRELQEQWVKRIGQFLGIPIDEVGIIGGGKMRIGKKITVALVQSLYRIADEVAPYFGHIVIDECHRTPSRTFTEAVSAFDCMYMLGLSATPWRRDGLSKLIFWYLGDVQHEVDKTVLIESGDILRADVITRNTDFVSHADPQEEYSRMLSELTEDTARNQLIAKDVIREATNGGGVCLVLTDRKEHCNALAALISPSGIETAILTGEVSNGSRKAIVERLNDGDVKVLIATGQLIGEGFDCKELSTLFLTTPIKFDGRLTQYLGRILRAAPGKGKATVYDYVDVNVAVLKASARARKEVYSQIGGCRE